MTMGARQVILHSWQEQASGPYQDFLSALHDEGVKDMAVTVIANTSIAIPSGLSWT
jgi:hypothetical protein